MLYDIAHQKGAGKELSRGVRWLSEKYGGKEFALHIKGLEMATHDPRGIFGDALGYTTANRGACHLSGNTFATDLLYGLMNPLSIKRKTGMGKIHTRCYGLCKLDDSVFIYYYSSFYGRPFSKKYTAVDEKVY